MPFRTRTAIVLLIFIGLLTYWTVAKNNFILGDDEDQIVNHAQVRSISNIPRFFFESTYYSKERDASFGLFYRPLMLSSYALLYGAFGPNPTVFHVFQLLLHVSNSIIVLLLMSSFFPLVLSFLLALIFLVHPINSETVVHASNLQDTLFFFFGGLALLVLTKNRNKQLSLKDLAVFGLYLLLSVFSKETGVLFGFISFVYAFLFSKKNIKKVAAVVAGAIILLVIFRFGIARIGFDIPIFSPIADADIFTRMLNMPAIFTEYLKTFIYPVYLPTIQLWLEEKISLYGFFVPLVFSVIFIAGTIKAGILLHKKKKELFLVYLFFTIWFALGMGAHMQIIPLELTVGLRWFYFPIAGILGMIAIICFAFFYKNARIRKAGLIICLGIITLLAIRTYIRIGDWRDSKTHFTKELQTSKGNYLLENNLGTLYIQEGEYEKAWPLVEDSLRQYQYFGNLNNMAVLYVHKKNNAKAEEYFKKAIRGQTAFMAYQNYSYFLLYFKKDYKEAIKTTSSAIQRYPAGSSLYLIRAQAEYQLGNYDQALLDAKTAYKILPSPWSEEVYKAVMAKKEIRVEKFYKL